MVVFFVSTGSTTKPSSAKLVPFCFDVLFGTATYRYLVPGMVYGTIHSCVVLRTPRLRRRTANGECGLEREDGLT